MAKKRTKEQKRRAQEERDVALPLSQIDQGNKPSASTFTFVAKTTVTNATPVLTNPAMQYVTRDLFKTAGTASLLFVVLVGIYLYLSYN